MPREIRLAADHDRRRRRSPPCATYADTSTLIQRRPQSDDDVKLGWPTGWGRQHAAAGRDAGEAAARRWRLGQPVRAGPWTARTTARSRARGLRRRPSSRSIRSACSTTTSSSIRLRVALFMGLLLVLIGVGAALAVRALTHTLQTFSDGIRAVAAGRFDQRLPVRGNDEFSQFGAVFNDMSSQLEQRIDELDSERRRVQEFGQRFGAALAATHDVTGLLEIVVDSAVQLARADGARLLVADEGTDVLVEQLRRGDLGAAAGPARRAGALRRGHRGPRPADAPGRDRRRARAAAGRAARGRGARARPAHAGRQPGPAVRARRRRARRLAGRARAPSRSRTRACTG